MCSEIVRLAREASEKIKAGTKKGWTGRKSKLKPWEVDFLVGGIAGYKLAFYMNHHYTINGGPVVCPITPKDSYDYLTGLVTGPPNFANVEVEDEDKHLFMTWDWQRYPLDESTGHLLHKLPPWKRLPASVRPFFFEAAIRTGCPSKRIVNVDARWKRDLLPLIMASKSPASNILNRIRDAAKIELGYRPSLFVVLEMKTRRGKPGTSGGKFSPHPHLVLAVEPETTNDDIRSLLLRALGRDPGVIQVKFNEPYPKRGAYLTKQARYTAKTMRENGFASDQFFAATNDVRTRAKTIWDGEVRALANSGAKSHDPRERLLSALLRYDTDTVHAMLGSTDTCG
jgi:hypothetical protein